jgi:hypothetical protein
LASSHTQGNEDNAVAFKFLELGEHIPVRSTWIPCHMIFDVKLDLTRKAHYVAGGHWTDTPSHLTYSSVVTRESVRIAFLIAALNDIEILSTDVGNAYLQAPTRERVHTTAGPEFGPHRTAQTVIIETLYDLNFKPTIADPDVWYRAACKADGFEYHEYILVYVDDILALLLSPNNIMETIRKAYRLKEDPTIPTTYLGEHLLSSGQYLVKIK